MTTDGSAPEAIDWSKVRRAHWLNTDGSVLQWNNQDLIGIGTFGVVVRRGEHALKVPRLTRAERPSEEEALYEAHDNNGNRESFENEKAVYQRVGAYRGIAEVISITDEGILMTLYQRGDLEKYIKNNDQPHALRLVEWIKTVVGIVCYFHQQNILLNDIALRNVLIADDWSLKMIDFGHCDILPPDAEIARAGDKHFNLQADIFYLGCLLYSIVTWQKFQIDLFDSDCKPPPLQDLPDTARILFGGLIQKCWQGECTRTEEVNHDCERMANHIAIFSHAFPEAQ
ncbi:MAG: hypothetical protein Q9174_005972 [Haloplaca sp. 1 TL-2023]